MPGSHNAAALVIIQACVEFFFDSLRFIRQAIDEVLSERSIVLILRYFCRAIPVHRCLGMPGRNKPANQSPSPTQFEAI